MIELGVGEYYRIGDSKYILSDRDEADENDILYLNFVTEINKENPIDETG